MWGMIVLIKAKLCWEMALAPWNHSTVYFRAVDQVAVKNSKTQTLVTQVLLTDLHII